MSGPPPKPKPSLLGLPPVPFAKLYTFATPLDRACIALGCASAAASGAILPLFSLIFGSALNTLNDPTANIISEINTLSLYFLLIAIGAALLSFLENALTALATERQMRRLRAAYCAKLLHLDAAWYDTHRAGECAARLAEASLSVGTGMDKVAALARYTATLCCGLAIGFTKSWKLTLVICACAPLFATALAVLIVTAISSERKERGAYARAGDAAAEAFSLVRAVAAFGGEAHEGARYGGFLASAEAAGIRKGLGIGGAVGAMLFTFYAMYGISTYAGAAFILDSRASQPGCRLNPLLEGCYTGGTVVTTFVAVLLGALSFGQIGPLAGQVAAARAAAADLYGVIDAVPGVDAAGEGGYRGGAASAAPDTASPAPAPAPTPAAAAPLSIEFRNVTFAYPSRPDAPVLRGFSLAIPAGQVVGVAGASGSGKSTLIALALRLYDVAGGAVLVDGVDVKQWHVRSLRAAFGLVSQEPVLFGASVADNIALGAPQGALPTDPAAARAAVEAAAASANAAAFVRALPRGFDTPAGTSVSASQLSGGQRQRICIARALMRGPRALLLDEATSALDTASERTVQAALDALTAASGLTCIVVAHRLSTLRSVARVVVMREGAVLEEGAPGELAAREGGVFRGMLEAQALADPGVAGGAGGAGEARPAETVVEGGGARPPRWPLRSRPQRPPPHPPPFPPPPPQGPPLPPPAPPPPSAASWPCSARTGPSFALALRARRRAAPCSPSPRSCTAA